MASAVRVAPPSPNSISFNPSPRWFGLREVFLSKFTTMWSWPTLCISFRLKWLGVAVRKKPRPSRGLGDRDVRVTGLQNPVGGMKDALGGSFTDRLAFCVRLNISAAKLRAGQSERFAAKQGHGLGFDFGHTARCLVSISHVTFGAMKD